MATLLSQRMSPLNLTQIDVFNLVPPESESYTGVKLKWLHRLSFPNLNVHPLSKMAALCLKDVSNVIRFHRRG